MEEVELNDPVYQIFEKKKIFEVLNGKIVLSAILWMIKMRCGYSAFSITEEYKLLY